MLPCKRRGLQCYHVDVAGYNVCDYNPQHLYTLKPHLNVLDHEDMSAGEGIANGHFSVDLLCFISRIGREDMLYFF